MICTPTRRAGTPHTTRNAHARPPNGQCSPFFIAFEGLDGSGKSTLANAVADRSGARYMTTPSETMRSYRQPIIDEYGACQAARQFFYLSTVFAARAQIDAALGRGESVVIDRYVDAPLAVRSERVARRGASPADQETLTSAADQALRELHLQRRALSVVGHFVIIDSARNSIEACVTKILAARDELIRG